MDVLYLTFISNVTLIEVWILNEQEYQLDFTMNSFEFDLSTSPPKLS